MNELEPIDIEFLVNEPEVKRNTKKVRQDLRDTVEDIEATTQRANQQINKALNSSTQNIQKNTQALRGQRAQYNGLGNSINQITRELPAFTFSAQTGFLAISNNLPILVDEIGRLKTQNDALVASGQKGQSVFKQVARSFFSLNTLFSVGITLLTVYGPQVAEFFRSLFSGKDALDSVAKSQEAVNRAFESSSYTKAIKEVTELRAAVELARDGFEDKGQVLEDYNKQLGDTLGKASDINEAEQLLIDKAPAYIEAMLFKAAAMEATSEAAKALAENQRNIFEAEQELEEARQAEQAALTDRTPRSSSASGIFINERAASAGVRQRALANEIDELEEQGEQLQEESNKIIQNLNKKALEIAKAAGLDFSGDGSGSAGKVTNDRQRLLDKLAAIDAEFARKQLERDDQEVQALEDKFERIRTEVQRFNADPKTKASARIDLKAFDELEQRALQSLDFDQDTRRLKEEIERQREIFKEFESFKKEFGLQKARERFAEEISEFDNFTEFIQKVYEDNQPTFQAFFSGDATAGQQERANLILEARDREQKLEEQKFIDLLAATENFEQRRNKLIEEYQQNRQLLLSRGNLTAARELKNIFERELNELDEGFAKGTDEYKALIKGVENLSDVAARKVIEDARKMVNALLAAGQLSEEIAAEINEKIDGLEREVDGQSADRFAKIANQIQGIAQAFEQLGQEIGFINQGLGDTIVTMAELTSVSGDAAQSIASFSTGDILGGITSGIRAITGIFSIGRRARESRREAEAELLRIQQVAEDGERRLNELLRERNIQKAQEVELSLKGIRAQREALQLAEQQRRADERALLQELQNEQFISDTRTERYGGFLGIGRKTRVVNEYADLLGLTFEEIEALFERGQLTERAAELFEQLRRLRQEGEDINGLLNNLEVQANQLFTGTTADALSDSIIEGIRNGYESFEDFGQDIEQILQGAILNSIKFQLLEEPLQRLFEQFAGFAESDGELTEAEAQAIRDAYNAQVQTAIDRYNELSDVLDLDALDNQDQRGLQGAIRRELTEQTGSELTGLFRGQFDITKRHFALHEQHFLLEQQHRANTMELMQINTRIEQHTKLTAETLAVAVQELTAIKRNTKQGQSGRDQGR